MLGFVYKTLRHFEFLTPTDLLRIAYGLLLVLVTDRPECFYLVCVLMFVLGNWVRLAAVI